MLFPLHNIKIRNWQIKVSHLLKASLQDTKETAQAQPTRTNAIKRKYFLVSFISHFYRLALNFLSIAFFLDIFLYVAGLFTVYSRLVSFTFDFFRLTSSCYSLRFSLSLLLNILRHFFQTIAAAALFFCGGARFADIMVDSCHAKKNKFCRRWNFKNIYKFQPPPREILLVPFMPQILFRRNQQFSDRLRRCRLDFMLFFWGFLARWILKFP